MKISPQKDYINLIVGVDGAVVDGDNYEKGEYYFKFPSDGIEVTGDFEVRHLNHLLLGEYKSQVRNINANIEPLILNASMQDISVSAGSSVRIEVFPEELNITRLNTLYFKLYGLSGFAEDEINFDIYIGSPTEFLYLARFSNDGVNSTIEFSVDNLITGKYNRGFTGNSIYNTINNQYISNDLFLNLVLENKSSTTDYLNDLVLNFSADRRLVE